jgi:predicted aspartyl protease
MKVKGIHSAQIEVRRYVLVLVTTTFLCVVMLSGGGAAAGDNPKEVAEKLAREAKKAVRSGKYDKAIQIYKDLIDRDPKDVQSRLGISLAYFKDQNYQVCFDHANEAIKVSPTSARAYALMGISLLRSGYVAGAVTMLVQSLKFDSKEPLAFGAAAEIDYYEGRSRESRAKALHAYYLDPYEPDYLITIARSASRMEMFGEAADAYEQFLTIAPKTDTERRDRIRGLIDFYRQLQGIEVHQVSGPSLSEVPFRLGADRRPYVKIRINGRDALLVIDTGSGFTVISQEAARRFGIGELARGGTSQGVGGDGKFPIIYGLIKNMQLGEVKVRAIPCFIRPFHNSKDRPAEERADGFIGLSILAHFITELDYKDSRMRLNRATDQPPPLQVTSGMTVVPFRTTQNGLISIETELDGLHRINAILDSGASSSVISLAAVERLKMHDQIIKGQTVKVIGAAGITENVELLFIRHCKVADLQQNNLRALVLDFGAINETSGFEQGGILGGDFLRHFRLTIDFIRTRIIFEPHTSAVIKQ